MSIPSHTSTHLIIRPKFVKRLSITIRHPHTYSRASLTRSRIRKPLLAPVISVPWLARLQPSQWPSIFCELRFYLPSHRLPAPQILLNGIQICRVSRNLRPVQQHSIFASYPGAFNNPTHYTDLPPSSAFIRPDQNHKINNRSPYTRETKLLSRCGGTPWWHPLIPIYIIHKQ